MIIATAAEWIAGHVLERIGHGKWWIIPTKNGTWTATSAPVFRSLGNPWCPCPEIRQHPWPYPPPSCPKRRNAHHPVDPVRSPRRRCHRFLRVLRHITKKMPRIAAMNDQIDAFTKRLSVRLYRYLEARVERAYPSVQPIPKQKEKSEVFAEGCSFYKIILLFIIGAFLGDIVETIFCRITAGVWMSAAALSGARSASSGASPSPSPPGSSIITETAPMAFYSPSEPSSAVPTNTSAAFSPKSSSEKFSGTTATFPSTSAAASTSCTASSGESPPSYG